MDKEKRDTFELLYKTHYKELYIHALSFVRDEEEAKDIVTDVYEYVWKNFEKLDSSVSLRPFLYSLVRSRSLDFLRKEKTKEKFLGFLSTSIKASTKLFSNENFSLRTFRYTLLPRPS